MKKYQKHIKKPLISTQLMRYLFIFLYIFIYIFIQEEFKNLYDNNGLELNIDCIKLLFLMPPNFNGMFINKILNQLYLNAALEKEIYANIPYGDKNCSKSYWMLNKVLYVLK